MSERVEIIAKRQRTITESKYSCLNHVSPTSNVVERLFSKAKLVFAPTRQSMLPIHLEECLYLYCNITCWDITTVWKIYKGVTVPITEEEEEFDDAVVINNMEEARVITHDDNDFP